MNFVLYWGIFAVLGMAFLANCGAQDVTRALEAMVVTADSEEDQAEPKGWLPDVAGTAVFAGKKTVVIDLEDQAEIVGSNFRQALSQTPSLLLAEESTPLVSIGYRGLNPHRAQFTQVLRDGIPIHADQLGYPEAYYTPVLETVKRIEFLHGGAALQHGPQPGGSLNFITQRPRTDREISLRTQHLAGSDDLYATFNSADGTVGKLGYDIHYHHRESDGFRSANSDYDLDNVAIKLLYTLENGGSLIFNADAYCDDHGEPGGLSVADFNSGSLKATRLYDRFSLDRDSLSLTYELDPTPDSFFVANAWWTDYTRTSKRQRGGFFGMPPMGNSNNIEDQNFETLGLDTRYRLNWGSETQHTLSTGVQVYHVDSPRSDSRGATPFASSGMVRRQSDREVSYLPIFVENKFSFGEFSITPGFRLENIRQEVTENINLDKGFTENKSFTDHIPLIGLGAEYATDERSSIYTNLSQAYRPRIFTEAVPLNNGQVVNEDLDEGRALEFELGYRSRPQDGLALDVSVFWLRFKDQIGSISNGGVTSFQNVGDSIHKGLDASVTAEMLQLMTGTESHNALDWYLNATLLDAEFTSGPVDGKTPQYAPDFIVRTGFTCRHEEKLKLTLGATFLDDHFADDNNSANFAVPAYMVWDLTAEWKVHENLRLLAGINNLFDESYFARVRADGIDPANGRNFYVGASLEF